MTTLEASSSDIANPEPDFKIYTGTMKAFDKPDDTRKYLRCTASSSIEDLHGDRMTEECVMGMAPQAKAKGMTIFLNHKYEWPEDVFGKTVDATIVSRSKDAEGRAIYDLDLEIQLNEANPRAVESYAAIKEQGIKAGISIGAMIEDWAFKDEDEGFWGGLEIRAINLLEASVVGIPANQRSWVVNALKSLGAPKLVIRKALGLSVPDPEPDPEPEPEPEPITDSITPDVETSTAPETEIPAEDSEAIEPADTETGLATLEDAGEVIDTLKATGADSALLDIVLGFLEGATVEVASLRKALGAVTEERDRLLREVQEAVEIVETLAATPIGRKAQFTGPVTNFRSKFGGFYDEGFLKTLEGVDNE